MVLSLKVLGAWSIRDGSGTTQSLPTRKAWALLGYLAVNADKPQPRERLMALLWSDRGEKQARQSLNQALSSVRSLGTREGLTLLESDDQWVMLRGDAVEIDVQRFRSFLADNPAKAMALYDGPFLDGLSLPHTTFENWLAETRSEIHTCCCNALDALANEAQEAGNAMLSIEFTRRLVAFEPLREDGHRRLMRLLYGSANRTAALRQYQRCVEILKNELQVEPDAATKSLYREIKQDAPAPDIEDAQPTIAQLLPTHAAPSLPDKPSIVVLPFDNFSDDTEQEFFADGMSEDIITALSKFRWLFVIARNSSFTYKGRLLDVKQIAQELGVRYVVEGSVRKGGEKLRVAAQLIDAESGNHMWADHFDGRLDDIFDLQDQITEAIVAAIAPEIGRAEIARAKRKPPESLDAWTLYQRGLSLYPSGAEEDFKAAIELFDRARAADPGFVDAIVMAAHLRSRYAYFFESDSHNELLGDASRLLQVAMRLDPRNSTCYMAVAWLHYTNGEYKLAATMAKEAVTLNPNSASAHLQLGAALFGANCYTESLQQMNTALRLSPNDPEIASFFAGQGSALFMLGRYEECAESALRCTKGPNPRYWADSLAVAALIKLGRNVEAKVAKRGLLERKPGFSIAEIEKFYLSAHPPELVKIYCDALREAGLPE